jgi:hypothetical protein
MKVDEILSLLPDSVLEELATKSQVNKYSKKLQGQVIFKLLVHCLLSHKDNSLRTMESAYESIVFKLLNGDLKGKKGIRYSSISERLSTIDSSYFADLYKTCVDIYGRQIGEPSAGITRFDSTIVTLTGQLLKVGYHIKGGDAEQLRQLKFTIGLSELPTTASFFSEQKYTSENAALKEVILSHQPAKANAIRIFDRGITSRNTHDQLTESKIPFISRIRSASKQEVVLENRIRKKIKTDSLTIFSDTWIYLFSERKRAEHPVRCIRAMHQSGEEIVFISNMADLKAEEIAALYKRRWDIEVFFKFIKQELNFSHLLNRSENGIRVILYTTLIAAILLLVYKKKNKLSGYKIMKVKFVQELEKAIIKDIVILCNGNPKIFEKYFENTPP